MSSAQMSSVHTEDVSAGLLRALALGLRWLTSADVLSGEMLSGFLTSQPERQLLRDAAEEHISATVRHSGEEQRTMERDSDAMFLGTVLRRARIAASATLSKWRRTGALVHRGRMA